MGFSYTLSRGQKDVSCFEISVDILPTATATVEGEVGLVVGQVQSL